MRWLLSLLTLLIIFAPLNAGAQEDQSEAPYLYYYSDDLNAFVIERADGTDTHILGDGLMQLDEEYKMYIDGPGWSPSGEWFAWTAAQRGPYYQSGFKPYVVSADGSRRLRSLDRFEHADMAWSPDRDLLFIKGQYTEEPAEIAPGEDWIEVNLHTIIALIDPETDTVIASFEHNTFSERWYPDFYPHQLPVMWTRDGQHAISEIYDYQAAERIFLVFNVDGVANEERIKYSTLPEVYGITRLASSVSPRGCIAYVKDDEIIVENLVTGEQQSFDNKDPYEYPPLLAWDPTGRYALLNGEHLWLLDLEDAEMSLLLESHILYTYSYPSAPVWSPDGRHALIPTNERLYHLEAESAVLSELLVLRTDIFPPVRVDWQWIAGGRAVASGEYDAETAIHRFYICDLDADIATPIEFECEISYFDSLHRLSPDGRYVAFVHDGATIYDTQNEICVRVRPDANSLMSFPGGEVYWHEDSEWLIVYEDALVAGGGGMRFLGIVRADGTMRRDLSYSPALPTSNAINWLPPQVDPDNLGSPIPEDAFPRPEQVIHGLGWSGYLSWSPDGKWLFGSNGGAPTVWDVATGELVMTLDEITWEQDVAWVLADESYVPQVVPREVLPSRENDYPLMMGPGDDYVVTTRGVFDVETEEMLLDWNLPSMRVTPGISPDGSLLVLPRTWSDTYIYDTQTWEIVASINTASVATVFSPDGTKLAVSSSWDIQIWGVAELLAAGSE